MTSYCDCVRDMMLFTKWKNWIMKLFVIWFPSWYDSVRHMFLFVTWLASWYVFPHHMVLLWSNSVRDTLTFVIWWCSCHASSSDHKHFVIYSFSWFVIFFLDMTLILISSSSGFAFIFLCICPRYESARNMNMFVKWLSSGAAHV